MLEREVKYLHSFNSYSSGKYLIWPERPDEVLKTNYLSVNNDSDAVLMFPTAIFYKRNVYKICIGLYVADAWSDTGNGTVTEVDGADLSIELYSGKANELSGLSYNVLVKNARKHKWYSEKENITITAGKGKREYDFTVGIPGIQQVIDSDDDTILLRLRVKNSLNSINIHNLYEENVWLRGETYSLAPVLQNPNPANVTIYANKEQTFSWEYEGDGTEQESYEIGWSSDNGSTWNTKKISSSAKESVYPKGTFPEKLIRWRVKVTNEEGTSSGYLVSEFLSVIQRPIVTVDFPNEINISNEKEQIFTWNYSGEDLAQKKYEIGWSSNNGSTWNSEEIISSNAFHVFSAGTFPTGEILWRIRATNSDGYVGEYDYGKFESVGKSEAPEIQSVSQNAIPTIIWTASNQEAFEICIKGENVDYGSGLVAGTETRSFRPNLMLEDGIYEIYIRILNTYGMYSEWGMGSILLNTEKPPYPPVLLLKENDLYGVTLHGYNSSGRGFFVRKGSSANRDIVIGESINGKGIIDCDLQPGQEYTYVFREYSGGYLDSTESIYKCEFTGVVFHDVENVENMVHIELSEDEFVNVDATLGKNVVYKKSIGREFPIKEADECKTERIVVTGFLKTEEYHRAYELFYLGKKVLFRDKNHCCHADICNFQKREYFEMGYIVTITFERLDRNEEVKLI